MASNIVSAVPDLSGDDKRREEFLETKMGDEAIGAKPNDDGLDIASSAVKSHFDNLTSRQAMWKFRRMFLTGVAASLGSTYYGYVSSGASSVIANKGFIKQFATVVDAKGQPALDTHIVALWGMIPSVMQICFQMISPFVVDKLGRRAGMWFLTLFMSVALILEIVAKTWPVWFVAKAFSGMGTGFHAPVLTVYMSEISLPQYRGALLSWYAISMAIGQFIVAIANQIVAHTPGDYRRVFYSEFVMLGLWMPCLLWCPESPVWYIRKGKLDKAKASLKRLVGNVKGYDLDHEFEVVRTQVMVSDSVAKSYSQSDWKSFFKWGNFRRAIAAAIPLTCQQNSGTAYIYSYTTYFFSLAGVNDAFLGSTILNIIYLVSLLISFVMMEKVGRRSLLLFGLFSLAGINFVIAGLGFLPAEGGSNGNALVAMCSIWMALYSLTVAPLGFVCLVEVSSFSMRAKTAAFGATINSLFGLIWSYTMPLMLGSAGGGAGWGQKVGFLFGILTAILIVPALFMYPETKGRLYTEIDELFERKIPIWRFHKSPTSIRPVPGGPTIDEGAEVLSSA